ncbi:MAG: ribonuclease HII [Magnetococcales bacterium]|nr:ribonuclease HII [Magnetococcales bacterium]
MVKHSTRPDLHLESALWAEGCRFVCGVDEVGRGPLAGPVVSAAVIFPPHLDLVSSGLSALNDSKKLSPTQRNRLLPIIQASALSVGIALVSPQEIDRINIRKASLLAMEKALSHLTVDPDYVLVDGRDWPPGLTCRGEAVIRGDGVSATIAAASVVAKVHRDSLMAELAGVYPGYGWERNQGYPTREHRQALLDSGVTEVHRRSFRPVREALERCREVE